MEQKQKPVTVSLGDLEAVSIPFSNLQDAFGPSSLRILIVKDLPSKFQSLRVKLLTYASYLAQLSAEELSALTNPKSHYNVGWSHGVEQLKSGRYDTMKGSYYATVVSSHLKAVLDHPSLYPRPQFALPNIWPSEDLLPGFQETLEELATLMVDIAVLVARACDSSLSRTLRESSAADATPEDVEDDSWCATHIDSGCLTALTSALFIDESNPLQPITSTNFPSAAHLSASPDPQAGLYIRSRTSDVVKVNIPADCLAFQTGEALQLITGGAFKAVPHFVRGPRKLDGVGKVARNTLRCLHSRIWRRLWIGRLG